MLIIVKFAVLYGLVKILITTRNAVLCAAIYATVNFLLTWIFGDSVGTALIRMTISFVLAFGYFWMLSRTRPATGTWYLIMIGGLLIGLV